MSAAMGYLARLGLGASSPVTEAFDFISESLALTETFIDTSGFSGTRSRTKERMRPGLRTVAGDIVMNPNPGELDLLLPRILGTAEATDVFALAETLPSFYVTIDRVAKVFTYSGCVVNSATFKAGEGAPLELTMNLMGLDETVGNAGTFPAITIGNATVPYIFSEMVLTIGGTAYPCKTFELMVNNTLEPQTFNSLTATRLNPTDREVTLTVQLPYGDSTAVYGTGIAGVAVSAVFTNGTVSCTFTLPAVQFPRQSPTITNVRGEVMVNYAGQAKKSGSTLELTVTSDSTV